MEALICIAIILAFFVLYEIWSAPTVYPDSCWNHRVRSGREKCTGPCTRSGEPPCVPQDKREART